MDETLLDPSRKQEVIKTPEQDKIPSVKVQVADQDDYQYAHQKEKPTNLEDAERGMINAIVEISGTYDIQISTILGKNSEKRTDIAQQLQKNFEETIRDLNPRDKQLSSESGSVEIIEPREPIEHEWKYGGRKEYQRAREKYDHAGFLALRLVEDTALKDLNNAWTDLDKVRRNIGLSSSWQDYAKANKSPYLWAEEDLKKRLIDLEIDQLDIILQQNLPSIVFGNPKTPQEARQKVFEKMERDLPSSIVKEKYDAGVLEPSVDREIHTFTKDPETGIRFVTQRGFRKRGGKEEFESWGPVGISGFGPNKEIYYLAPEYRKPAYSTKSGVDWNSFKPFYRGKGTYEGIAPLLTEERQIEIWEAYCRAVCDVDATKKDFREDSDWRYSLKEIYWGDQMRDIERYKMLSERLKIARILKDADASDFGKVRLGIRLRESNMAESDQKIVEGASEKQLKLIRDLFEKYWQNPNLSEFVIGKNADFISFDYPYASDMHFYPDDYGKTMELRLNKADLSQSGKKNTREILIRDAHDEDNGLTVTGYLKVDWNEEGNWKIERGRHSQTNAYFLQPQETRNSLTQKDAETVLLALGLLNQPKQKRG